MKKVYLCSALVLSLFACNSTKTNSENSSSTTKKADTENPTDSMKIMIPDNSCYAAVISDVDGALLKLEVFPNVVTGILKYNFAEKDSNEGTLEGKLVGDKIFADYTFKSEGKTSVREVAFLIQGKKITEGYGEMIESNGKMVFKDKKQINYKDGTTFSTIDCVENDEKFRLKN